MGRAISLRYYPIKGQPTASPMLDGGSSEEDLSGPVSDIFKIIFRRADIPTTGGRAARERGGREVSEMRRLYSFFEEAVLFRAFVQLFLPIQERRAIHLSRYL